jgi:hypothetical protein
MRRASSVLFPLPRWPEKRNFSGFSVASSRIWISSIGLCERSTEKYSSLARVRRGCSGSNSFSACRRF